MTPTPMERKLKKHVHEFSLSLKKVAKNPKPKDIHELRILSRRLRAALWLYGKGSKVSIPKNLQKDCKDLGKTLGATRELDVLLKDMATYSLKDQKLIQARERESQKLKKFLGKSFCNRIEQELKAFIEKAQGTALSKKELTLRIKKPIRRWPSSLPQDKKSLHKIRIETKKIIYRLELLGITTHRFKILQRQLGRIHDLERLSKKQGPHKKMKTDLDRLASKARGSYKIIAA